MTKKTDEQLRIELQGDQAEGAMFEVVQRYWWTVFNLLNTFANDVDAATNDTLHVVWRRRHDIRAGCLRSFIMGTVRNRRLREQRRRRRQGSVCIDVEDVPNRQPWDVDLVRRAVHSCLQSLREKSVDHARVAEAHLQTQGRTSAIAERLGCSVRTVQRMVKQLRPFFRMALEEIHAGVA